MENDSYIGALFDQRRPETRQIRLPLALRARLKQLAQREHRTVNNEIIALLEEAVERRAQALEMEWQPRPDGGGA